MTYNNCNFFLVLLFWGTKLLETYYSISKRAQKPLSGVNRKISDQFSLLPPTASGSIILLHWLLKGVGLGAFPAWSGPNSSLSLPVNHVLRMLFVTTIYIRHEIGDGKMDVRHIKPQEDKKIHKRIS
jgi:hypothetical protein